MEKHHCSEPDYCMVLTVVKTEDLACKPESIRTVMGCLVTVRYLKSRISVMELKAHQDRWEIREITVKMALTEAMA